MVRPRFSLGGSVRAWTTIGAFLFLTLRFVGIAKRPWGHFM